LFNTFCVILFNQLLSKVANELYTGECISSIFLIKVRVFVPRTNSRVMFANHLALLMPTANIAKLNLQRIKATVY